MKTYTCDTCGEAVAADEAVLRSRGLDDVLAWHRDCQPELLVPVQRRYVERCCETHDGPHLHRCALPRDAAGRTHPGACRLHDHAAAQT